jgi:hypothetical protein
MALVDDADYERLARHRWAFHPQGYVFRTVRRKTVLMHREVLGLGPSDKGVDHRDGNPLDNRRANLRLASQAENCQNVRARGGTSRFRGVSWDRKSQKWYAKAKLNGRQHALGLYEREEDAAAAAAAFRRQHMPFAVEAA